MTAEETNNLEEKLKAKSDELEVLRSKFTDLINNSPVGVYSIEVDGGDRFIEVNPALINILGAESKDVLLGTGLSKFYFDPKKNHNFLDNVIKKGTIKDEILELNTLKGQKIIAAFSMVAKKNKKGITTIDGCVQDITKQRITESFLETKIRERTEELEIANEKLLEVRHALLVGLENLNHERSLVEEERIKIETILNSIGSGLLVTDINNLITKASSSFFSMLNLTKDDVIGKSIQEVLHIEDEFGKKLDLNIECGIKTVCLDVNFVPRRVNCYVVRQDTSRLPVLIISTPVKIAGVISVVRTLTDTTQEKENERQKNEFLSIASHQLRTPLSITKWSIDLFMQDKNLTIKQKDRLQDLYDTNERLIMLVNDLLCGIKIEKSSIVLKRSTINIISLIRELISSADLALKKKNQSLRFDVEIEPKPVLIDLVLFNEVITNLLDNANKYAEDGAEIVVKLSEFDKYFYLISVHNSASYIPYADRDKIFTKFYRGAGSRKKIGAGTGLGLYIAKSAAEANGGKIWFESSPESGTTFYFTIPRSL